MSDKSLRFGLVGCGLMGAHYADVYGRMAGMTLAACCDPTPSKLNRFAKDKGFEMGFLDYKDLMEDLDGVANVTPDALHAEVALAAMNAGIPLITEKPLAGSMEEGLSIAKVSEQTGTPLMLNFSKRNAVAVGVAERIVRDGGMGGLIRIEASYRQGWVYTKDWGDWKDVHAWAWRLCGKTAPLGVLADLGSHLIDLIRHVTGREIVTVGGGFFHVVDKGIESLEGHRLDSPDLAQARFSIDENIQVELLCSRVDVGRRDELKLIIFAEKGVLEINLETDRKAVKVSATEDIQLPEGLFDPENSTAITAITAGESVRISGERPLSSYTLFARVMAGETLEKLPEAPGLRDGLAVQAVMDAMLSSATAGGKAIALGETIHEHG